MRKALLSVFLSCCNGLLFSTTTCRKTRTPLVKKYIYRKQTANKALATAGALVTGAYLLSRDTDIYTPKVNSLTGQTIVITGASSGLGLETAQRLAVAGANLILTTRSDTKGALAVATVRAHLEEQDVSYADQMISYKTVDFNDLESVRTMDWSDVDTIDVLVNNAGVMAIPDRTLTKDRVEVQMQSNHLGPFLLTAMLSKKFSDTARIVNVSSAAHQIPTSGIDFEFLWKAELGYSPWLWYGYSKLANLYFTQELQRRVNASSKHWTVVAVHPGVIATNLGRYSFACSNNALQSLGGLVAGVALKSPEEGATTQIWLAAGNGQGGKYYVDQKVKEDVPNNLAQAKRLWKESERLVGRNFELDT